MMNLYLSYIELDLTDALTLYLALSLLILFGVWSFFTYRERTKKRPPDLFELAVCEYCDVPYLAMTINAIQRCPRCGLLNNNNWYRKQKEEK